MRLRTYMTIFLIPQRNYKIKKTELFKKKQS
jgi:hypothetical protein